MEINIAIDYLNILENLFFSSRARHKGNKDFIIKFLLLKGPSNVSY